jgi:cob(I)alamin adenosyltransferase
VHDAWNFASAKMMSGEYDLVILDEINYAISYKMLDAKEGQGRSNEGRNWCMSF